MTNERVTAQNGYESPNKIVKMPDQTPSKKPDMGLQVNGFSNGTHEYTESFDEISSKSFTYP